MMENSLGIAQVVYNADTATIEFRIPLQDGTGDHVLATLPATPPPGDEPE
jgi:hypothetical protein